MSAGSSDAVPTSGSSFTGMRKLREGVFLAPKAAASRSPRLNLRRFIAEVHLQLRVLWLIYEAKRPVGVPKNMFVGKSHRELSAIETLTLQPRILSGFWATHCGLAHNLYSNEVT